MYFAGERNVNIHEQEVNRGRLLSQNIYSPATCMREFTFLFLDVWLIYMVVLTNGDLGWT